ncbi:PTPA-CTERM sorting domain-containing protein [Leptothoe spongobia]|uniref:PTPA-CTERM sorting domain-containing protein n=1 Tax=Leptothoe spongobia TAU-MAC 1115 TaxID=1967444 RepID=A0A947GL71_9CYAN|nr:PTPA-CTERM sorting domain-containing protein [Leptothoe spongobia]MBT9317263.1 PTPA-CTERM sorting domain-containing protein [Leptothoe spongobia TAU-MAC 1115]
MNFKNLTPQAAAVATALAVSALVSANPAHASQLSGSIDLETFGNFNLSDTLIDFDGAEVQDATGSFAPLVGDIVDIEDITLTPPTTTLGTITPFVNFGTVILEGESNSLVFNLTSATIETLVDNDFVTVLLAQDIEGVFQFGEESIALGVLTSQSLLDSDGFTLNLATQQIPTPALLPGLLSLGLGIVRQRNQKSNLAEES